MPPFCCLRPIRTTDRRERGRQVQAAGGNDQGASAERAGHRQNQRQMIARTGEVRRAGYHARDIYREVQGKCHQPAHQANNHPVNWEEGQAVVSAARRRHQLPNNTTRTIIRNCWHRHHTPITTPTTPATTVRHAPINANVVRGRNARNVARHARTIHHPTAHLRPVHHHPPPTTSLLHLTESVWRGRGQPAGVQVQAALCIGGDRQPPSVLRHLNQHRGTNPHAVM